MNQPPELREKKGITYLEPAMKFNLGTLSYMPTMPRKLSNNKLPKKEKVKVWVLSAILILIMIILLWFNIIK